MSARPAFKQLANSLARPGRRLQSTTSTPSPSGPLPISWPDYLNLRRRRKLYATIATVPTTIVGLMLGGGYFANIEADPTQTIMGIEPVYVYAGATVGCMGLGYLLGPTLGNTLFSLTHRTLTTTTAVGRQRVVGRDAINTMDKAFHNRIRARRGDPSFQSVNNPAPDYYGEKVTSLKTYRRWLRDQAAYKRKAENGVPGQES